MHNLILELVATAPGVPDAAELERSLPIFLDALRSERGGSAYYELALSLVDDAAMAEVNREQRGKNATTDVLSFPLLELHDGELPADLDPAALSFPVIAEQQPVGDLLISVPTCVRQAGEIGHSVHDEFYRLAVHGILHLFGYDHETGEAEARRMRKREDELLALLASQGL